MSILSIDTWAINGGDTYVKHDPATRTMRLRSKAQVERDFAAGKINNVTRSVLYENFIEDDLEAPLQVGVDQKQLDWIAATLKASTAGHFPVHSITTGEHGDTTPGRSSSSCIRCSRRAMQGGPTATGTGTTCNTSSSTSTRCTTSAAAPVRERAANSHRCENEVPGAHGVRAGPVRVHDAQRHQGRHDT